MTVSSTTALVTANGNGVATTFSFSPIVIFDEGDLTVIHVDDDGVETTLTLNTHYTVSVSSYPGTGSIVYPVSGTVLPTGESLIIKRELDLIQEVDLAAQGAYNAEVQEQALDRLTMICLQIKEVVDRALTLAISASDGVSLALPAPEAGLALVWNDDGTALENSDLQGETGPQGPAGPSGAGTGDMLAANNLSDVASAATSRTNLGLAIGTNVQAFDAELAALAGLVSAANKIPMFSGSGTATMLDFKDEDNMSSDSATALPSQQSVKAYVDTEIAAAVAGAPAGTVVFYAGASDPSGWLICDGAAVSRATYSDLFTAIGTTFGAGDGATTFNVPNLAGRVPLGIGTGAATASGSNADVDTTADTLTVASNNTKWITGMQVTFTLASGTITGLTSGNTYYIIRSSATLVKLASTLANAQNGTAINMTAKSSPEWTITHALTARTLAEQGGEQSHAMSSTELLAHTHTFASTSGGGTGVNTSTSSASGTTTTNSTGGNAAANVMPPFLGLRPIIKT